MRTILKLTFCALLALPLGPGARADSDDAAPQKSHPVQIGQNAAGETVLTLDEATQQRLGLVTTNPVAAGWQPEIRATGRVADSRIFLAAAADYEAARAVATASHADLERTRTLAKQQNAAPRALEAAQAAAARDALAVQSAGARFAADWGLRLAARTNLTAYGEDLQTNASALIKVTAPSGMFLNPLPAAAEVSIFNSEQAFTAEFADDLGVDPGTQTQTLLFSAKQKLPPGIAVVARIKHGGEVTAGVTVPASAVLRHDDAGWVFVQTGATEFTRRAMPLDERLPGGYFSASI
ncbi:MAG TPA: hypothetical protein VF988_03920, partial [Verrucomicrobiae bacterium]